MNNFREKHTRLPVHYHLRLSLEGQELLSGTSSFQLCTWDIVIVIMSSQEGKYDTYVASVSSNLNPEPPKPPPLFTFFPSCAMRSLKPSNMSRRFWEGEKSMNQHQSIKKVWNFTCGTREPESSRARIMSPLYQSWEGLVQKQSLRILREFL